MPFIVQSNSSGMTDNCLAPASVLGLETTWLFQFSTHMPLTSHWQPGIAEAALSRFFIVFQPENNLFIGDDSIWFSSEVKGDMERLVFVSCVFLIDVKFSHVVSLCRPVTSCLCQSIWSQVFPASDKAHWHTHTADSAKITVTGLPKGFIPAIALCILYSPWWECVPVYTSLNVVTARCFEKHQLWDVC